MKSLFSKYALPAFLAAALVFALFSHSCANTTQAPTGGAKDTIPPMIVKVSPAPGALSVPVHGTQIVFTFDEYVVVKEPKGIYLSPPQEKSPKYRIRGKSVVVYFEEDLLPNTTYTLDLTGAIVDNNEGNFFPGYTAVFSTGTSIDSMMVTGTVQDCEDLKPIKGATRCCTRTTGIRSLSSASLRFDQNGMTGAFSVSGICRIRFSACTLWSMPTGQ